MRSPGRLSATVCLDCRETWGDPHAGAEHEGHEVERIGVDLSYGRWSARPEHGAAQVDVRIQVDDGDMERLRAAVKRRIEAAP